MKPDRGASARTPKAARTRAAGPSPSEPLPVPLASDQPGELVRRIRGRLAASASSRPEEDVLILELGRALYAQHRFSETSDELGRLIARPGLARDTLLQAMGVLAGALVQSERIEEGRQLAMEVLAAADADAETRVLARSAVRGVAFFEGRLEDAVAEARHVIEEAAGGSSVARAEARIDMGGMLLHADAFDEAARWLVLDEDAAPHQRDEALELAVLMDLVAGRWSVVLDHLPLDGPEAQPADRPDLRTAFRRGMRAHALLHLDRLEEALRELEAIPVNSPAPAIALVASALLGEAAGGPAAAAGHVERIARRFESELRARPQLRVWGPELVRVAVAAGDRATARRLVDATAAVASRTAVPSVRGAALAALGILEREPEPLRGAVAAYAAGPRLPAHAQAMEMLGLVLLERGYETDAIASLRDAWQAFASVDAERDVRRISRTLAELGVRMGRSGPRRHGRTGWASLSPTERTVAALVAEGMTNVEISERLVVSRRTVESHVAHILDKLDVRSRVGISRVLATRPST